VALRTKLTKELVERGFIRNGAFAWELATIRNLGRLAPVSISGSYDDEIIAIEAESVDPGSGVEQLRGGFKSPRFSSTEFFDRRVLAVPSSPDDVVREEDLDILTYDSKGFEYREAGKPTRNV
jgi:hypothetical protein